MIQHRDTHSYAESAGFHFYVHGAVARIAQTHSGWVGDRKYHHRRREINIAASVNGRFKPDGEVHHLFVPRRPETRPRRPDKWAALFFGCTADRGITAGFSSTKEAETDDEPFVCLWVPEKTELPLETLALNGRTLVWCIPPNQYVHWSYFYPRPDKDKACNSQKKTNESPSRALVMAVRVKYLQRTIVVSFQLLSKSVSIISNSRNTLRTKALLCRSSTYRPPQGVYQ